MALIDRLKEANNHIAGREYYRLDINSKKVGYVDSRIIEDLDKNIFSIDYSNKKVSIIFEIENKELVEEKLELFFKDFYKKNNLVGWRNERYKVSTHYEGEELMLIERGALSYLGITGYGVHINGYIKKGNDFYMWIAKRSKTKPTSPGKLDQIAAGGLPAGITRFENVIKECEEEASIPAEISKNAKYASALTYWYDKDIGVRPDTIFNYDLLLPNDFIPMVNDKEVESFELVHMDDILSRIATTKDFKFNSSIVIIDFAIRHSIIDENHIEYIDIINELNNKFY